MPSQNRQTPPGTPPIAGSPPGLICYVTDQINRIKVTCTSGHYKTSSEHLLGIYRRPINDDGKICISRPPSARRANPGQLQGSPMPALLLNPAGASRGYIPDGHRRNWDLSVTKKRRLPASPRNPSARIKTAKVPYTPSVAEEMKRNKRRTALIIVTQSSGGTQVFVIVHGKALVECRSVTEGFVPLIGALYCFQQPHPASIAPATVFIEHHLRKDPNVNRADLTPSFLKAYTKYESFRNGRDSGSETEKDVVQHIIEMCRRKLETCCIPGFGQLVDNVAAHNEESGVANSYLMLQKADGQTKPQPELYFLRRMFLWMPRRMYLFDFRCPNCPKRALTGKGTYNRVRLVLDTTDYYYLCTEYLTCSDCGGTFPAWDSRLLHQLPDHLKMKFPALLTRKYACDRNVVALLRSRTLGNSSTALRNTVMEMHSEEWLRKQVYYLSACKEHRKRLGSFGLEEFGYDEAPSFPPFPQPRWFLATYVRDIYMRLPALKAAVTSTFGNILKIDSTKNVCRKLQGESAGTAGWSTNIGNERGQVLQSVLTTTEGKDALEAMASGLMKRYRDAGQDPPVLLYTDRDCCAVSGPSRFQLLFSEWEGLEVRLDIWHYMRRIAVGCTSEAHPLYGTFMTQLSSCIFEWSQYDYVYAKLLHAKEAELIASGIPNPPEGAVKKAITKDELAKHCSIPYQSDLTFVCTDDSEDGSSSSSTKPKRNLRNEPLTQASVVNIGTSFKWAIPCFPDNNGHLPNTLYLQLDNSVKECKNNYIIAFAAWLVHLRIFRKVKLCYLMNGHTHEDVDQMFSRFSTHLERKDAPTIPELLQQLSNAYTPQPECRPRLDVLRSSTRDGAMTKAYAVREDPETYAASVQSVQIPVRSARGPTPTPRRRTAQAGQATTGTAPTANNENSTGTADPTTSTPTSTTTGDKDWGGLASLLVKKQLEFDRSPNLKTRRGTTVVGKVADEEEHMWIFNGEQESVVPPNKARILWMKGVSFWTQKTGSWIRSSSLRLSLGIRLKMKAQPLYQYQNVLAASAMETLSRYDRQNTMYHLAYTLGTSSDDGSGPRMPVVRMPFPLIEHNAKFFSVDHRDLLQYY
ncbi:hypothetical protein Bbelb_035360 [Branchiostoma belcheri]|nr:hypothetical protein Bbelb_035360 [Branchiostoma belcheri]